MQELGIQMNTLEQRAFQLGLNIIRLMDDLPKKRSAWVIEGQIVRSATSIGANLIEGRSSTSRTEFRRFQEIALRSAHETHYWLSLLRDSHLISPEHLVDLLMEIIELRNMIGASVKKLKSE